VAPPPSKYLPLAEWMRSKDSRLKWTEGIIMNFGRRIECFRGQQVLDALMNANFKNHSSLSSYASATRDELIATLDAMITEGFFTRVVALDIAKRPAADAPQELRVQLDEEKTFDVDALFMWTFESKSSAPLFKALGSIALVIFVCCFKVWPIWMRIVVWWLSLILLVTLLTMIVFHIVSGPLFFVVGLRGLYFMPNLFDEEIDFFDTFSPLFGYGGEHQLRWREEREAQRAARERLLKKVAGGSIKEDDEAGAAAAAAAKDKTTKPPAKGFAGAVSSWLRGMSGWQFGYLNAAAFIIVGVMVSNWFGLFMPENVPEFILSPNELYSMFPSLAPPTADLNANTPEPEPVAPTSTEHTLPAEPAPIDIDLDSTD